MKVSTQIIRSRDWIDAHQVEIDDLLASSDLENFYFSTPWLQEWLKRQTPGIQIIIIVARSHTGELVGFWPFVERPGLLGTKGLWPFVYDEANYFHPVCMFDAALPLINGLESLLGEFLFCWIPLMQDSFWSAYFESKIAVSKFLTIHRKPRNTSFLVPSKNTSFEDYWSLRVGGKTRKSYRYDQKSLAGKGNIRVDVFTTFDEVRTTMPATCVVEVESWKSKERAGLYTARGKRGFFFDLLPKLAGQGRVHLSVLQVDEQPIAWQIELVGKQSIGLHHLAFDDGWKKYSPGKQLLQYRLQQIWREGKAVDFLPGHFDYKDKLASVVEPVHELHWFRKTWRGYLARRLILGNIKVRKKILEKAKETKVNKIRKSVLQGSDQS